MTQALATAQAGRRDMQGNSMLYAWYVVSLLTLTQIVSYMDRFLPGLLLEPIKHDLHLNDFQIGLLLGPAFAVFFIALGIPIGWLADRVSRRALLAIGITFWCLMTAMGSIARDFLPLFTTRLGVGVGEATVVPSSMSLIGDYFPRERRSRAISLFMTGTFLGAGSSFLFFGPLVHHIEALPPITLPLLGQLQSWRLCFLIVGLPGIVMTLLMLTVREPARMDRVALDGEVSLSKPSLKDAISFIGKYWMAFGALFIASASNLTMGALSFWNVALFKRSWGWNVGEVGTAVGLILLTAGPAGTLFGIWMTNRGLASGRRDATLRVLFLGLMIGVPAYTIFPLMPSATIGLVALFCAHIGQSMATAAGPATLMMLAPGQLRGQVTAIYYLVISIVSQLLGPPLVGAMTDAFGNPADLRYAVSLEVLIVGLPALVLAFLGFAAYRRSVVEMDGMLAREASPAQEALLAS
jgi:MFS family permease